MGISAGWIALDDPSEELISDEAGRRPLPAPVRPSPLSPCSDTGVLSRLETIAQGVPYLFHGTVGFTGVMQYLCGEELRLGLQCLCELDRRYAGYVRLLSTSKHMLALQAESVVQTTMPRNYHVVKNLYYRQLPSLFINMAFALGLARCNVLMVLVFRAGEPLDMSSCLSRDIGYFCREMQIKRVSYHCTFHIGEESLGKIRDLAEKMECKRKGCTSARHPK